MVLSDTQLLSLAMQIVKQIKLEFADKHLSGNLAETVNVTQDSNGIHVRIPATSYNVKKYMQEGIIQPYYGKSYADKLDKKGSEFRLYKPDGSYIIVKPHNHIGYIEKVITKAVAEWTAANNISLEDIQMI